MPFKTHKLKCWPSSFRLVVEGKKPFEVRVNDRDFEVGDLLALYEYSPDDAAMTGWMTSVSVLSMVQGKWGLPPDVCVMGFDPEMAKRLLRQERFDAP